jgi:hypothetical protein
VVGLQSDGEAVMMKLRSRHPLRQHCVLLLISLLVLFPRVASTAAAAAADNIVHSGKTDEFTFVRAHHPEDLIRIPQSLWLVASSMSVDKGKGVPGGGLYLANLGIRVAVTIDKAKVIQGTPGPEFSNCPGPPPENLFAAHGLAIQEMRGRPARLLVVNHGGRQSIEVFDISMKREMPQLHWVGCVVFPNNLSLNAVAPIRHGGFVVTSMLDFNDPARWQKMQAGEDTGVVYRWTPEHDPVPLPGTEACGNNGIEVSSDGSIYLAAWGGKAILRLREHEGRFVSAIAPVDFHPDNLRWSPNGKLLIAGQRRDLKEFLSGCGSSPCKVPWVAAEFDPQTMKITTILESDGLNFSDATTALRVGNELWLGSATEDRIAIVPIGQR